MAFLKVILIFSVVGSKAQLQISEELCILSIMFGMSAILFPYFVHFAVEITQR